MNSTNSETRTKGRGGRTPDPNKLRFVSIGLRPDQRAWLRLWRLNPDLDPPEPGSEEDNPTEQLRLLIETAMKFFPDGSAFHQWPREANGRFAKREK